MPGRNAVFGLGYVVPPRYRPSEEATKSHRHWDHVVAATDTLISVRLLAKSCRQVELVRMLNERQLKLREWTVKVSFPVRHAGRGVAGTVHDTVQPDAFVELHIRRGAEVHQECYCFEVDLGSEFQVAWREKVRALVAFAQGAYQKTYGSPVITVAVVAAPGQRRAELLRSWTEAELTDLSAEADASLFAFVGADPAKTPPVDLFCAPVWTMPFHHDPFPLISDLEEGRG